MTSSYFSQTRSEIESLLPPEVGSVMEIGCGGGNTLAWLKREHGAQRTIGIELMPEAAAVASAQVDEVHVADITQQPQVLDRFEGQVDLLLLLDVLEHLRDPLGMLRRMKSVLARGGQVIASIPNVRSLKVLVPLVLQGEFRYTDSGILDRTHVVFFTRKSVLRLVAQAGLDCTAIRGNGALTFDEAKTPAGKAVAAFNQGTFGVFEGFLANQWLVAARPSAAPGAA